MLNIAIGQHIKELRIRRGWTQEKLGELLSVSHQVISKWENAITCPDVCMLYSLSQLFQVSLDELCGTMIETVTTVYPLDEQASFHNLHEGWEHMEEALQTHPFHTDLLVYALKYLRLMHDKIETDMQKEIVNTQILSVAQRILDVSTEDACRSLAHYNLAVFYDEQVNRLRGNREDRENARLAKEHADKVLYRDMHPPFYPSFGTSTTAEDYIERKQFLFNAIEHTVRAAKNLLQMPGAKSKETETALVAFLDSLKEASTTLNAELSI